MSKKFAIISIEVNGVPIELSDAVGELTAVNPQSDTPEIKLTGASFEVMSRRIPVEMLPAQNNPYLS